MGEAQWTTGGSNKQEFKGFNPNKYWGKTKKCDYINITQQKLGLKKQP
jgi:hypothetical protein